MKSYGDLFSQITCWDNLLRAAKLASKRKRVRLDVMAYRFRLEHELVYLQHHLRSGTYQPGGYTSFEICDPKRRTVSAAPFRDRVLHHAICRVIEPILDRSFIFDSYACRRGKGQVLALRRARYYARRYPFVIQTDIRKYFATIDHDILYDQLERKFRDPQLKRLLNQIIRVPFFGQTAPGCFPGDDLLTPLERSCGLPIGNLTSQLWANLYLDPLDHFMKDQLRVPGYIRYMDDLLLFVDSKNQAWDTLKILEEKILSLRLRLHPKKTSVSPTRAEFPFLGFHVSQTGFRPFRKTVQRFRIRMKCLQRGYEGGDVELSDIRQSIAAYAGHFKICGQTKRWRKILSDFPCVQTLRESVRTDR